MANAWRWAIAVLSIAAAAWYTATSLTEAFGSGPPYYSRTTNMDKWESPVPTVIAVDLAALALSAVVLSPLFRRRDPVRRTDRPE
jgi:hypothetical protein